MRVNFKGIETPVPYFYIWFIFKLKIEIKDCVLRVQRDPALEHLTNTFEKRTIEKKRERERRAAEVELADGGCCTREPPQSY